MKEKIISGSNKIQVYHDFITPQGHKIRLGFEEGRLFSEYSGQKTYYTNANGKIAIDELFELTTGAGITIDGVIIKDGDVSNLRVKTVKKTIGHGGMQAQGTLIATAGGDKIVNNDKVTIDGKIYTFKTELTPTEGEVLIGVNDTASLLNLKNAINHDGTPNVDYKCAAAHPTVEGLSSDVTTLIIIAAEVGVSGNLIALSTTGEELSWDDDLLGETVSGIDPADTDYNFSPDGNTTEQSIELEDVIPALARIVDIFIVTEEVYEGAVTLVADVGPSEGDGTYIASATIYDEDEIIAIDMSTNPIPAPNAADTSIFINVTPGAEWNLIESGKSSVYISYIDVANI